MWPDHMIEELKTNRIVQYPNDRYPEFTDEMLEYLINIHNIHHARVVINEHAWWLFGTLENINKRKREKGIPVVD